jgi:hypothetical protein
LSWFLWKSSAAALIRAILPASGALVVATLGHLAHSPRYLPQP